MDNIRFRVSSAGNQQLPALRQASWRTILELQKYPADIQLQALALVLTAMSETLNLDPHDMVSRARRQLADADAAFVFQFQAIRDFAGNEMREQLAR